MKRIFALTIALVLILALCACGSQNAPTETASEPAAEAAPAAEAPAAPEAPAAQQAEVPQETAADEAASGAPSEEPPAKPDGSKEPSAKPDGEASGESSSAPEDVQVQDFSVFPMDGYPKTFEGYIDWVCAALESQPGNPNLESELAAVRATTEDTYNPDAMPFSMQIRFSLICSYEDFLG